MLYSNQFNTYNQTFLFYVFQKIEIYKTEENKSTTPRPILP